MQIPASYETEMALLGNMMVDVQSATFALQSGLNESDFHLPANKTVFKAIQTIHGAHQVIDASLVIDTLREHNELNTIGGVDYVYRCCDCAISSTNTQSYIEILQEKRQLRALIETCQKISNDAMSGNVDDAAQFLSLSEEAVLGVTRNRKSGDFQSSTTVVNEVIEKISAMSENKSSITGIKSLYKDLDRTLHGFQRGDLIILAARPSMGKTAVAVDIAANMAMNGAKVAFFSLEMPAGQLMQRILSYKSSVPNDHIRNGYLNNQEWNALSEAAANLKNCALYFDDSPSITVAEMAVKCRKLRNDDGLDAIMVDYIQLIKGNGRYNDNRQQEVSDISRNLKALARELNVPIIALSQLSRNVEGREDKHPMMSDLRESGALEQDADVIMLLYREAYYNKEAKERAEANGGNEVIEINIAKHRNGATRRINLAFNGNVSGVYNLETNGASA